MGVKIIHHNDLDGRCAAAIVKFYYPHAEFYEMNYGMIPPIDKIEEGDSVYVLDFSFEKYSDWEDLLAVTDDVTWIDHHQSAVNKWEDLLKDRVFGIREMGKSGAWLTWEYMNERSTRRVPISPALIYVDKWDTWNHENRSEILDFVSGMSLEDTRPDSEIWIDLLHEESKRLNEIQRRGESVRLHMDKESAVRVKYNSYETNIHGYKALACNTDRRGSMFFRTAEGYDIYCSYVWSRDVWKISFYSDAVKVNEIAEQYGGGGHPGAAGFESKKLPTFLRGCRNHDG
jgi:oligoribonuclease NrnB/cAMP/cGMP phosphodiesterase (DHH superfamily)